MSKLDEAVNSYLDSRGIDWKKGRFEPTSRWDRITKWMKGLIDKSIKIGVVGGGLPGALGAASRALTAKSDLAKDFESIIFSNWKLSPEEVATRLQKDKGYSEEEAVNYVNKMMEIK